MPDKDFQETVAHLKAAGEKIHSTSSSLVLMLIEPVCASAVLIVYESGAEPHYDAHGNEYDPSEREGENENAPMSYRGPGFDRMSP